MDRLTYTAMALALCSAFFAFTPARAATDDGLAEIQHDWEQIRYQSPAGDRVKRYEALAVKAHRLTEARPGRSEPLIWEGIVVSSLAGGKTANVLSAGLMPGTVGLYQVVLELNSDLPTNPQTQMTIAQDIYISNIVSFAVLNKNPATN